MYDIIELFNIFYHVTFIIHIHFFFKLFHSSWFNYAETCVFPRAVYEDCTSMFAVYTSVLDCLTKRSLWSYRLSPARLLSPQWTYDLVVDTAPWWRQLLWHLASMKIWPTCTLLVKSAPVLALITDYWALCWNVMYTFERVWSANLCSFVEAWLTCVPSCN